MQSNETYCIYQTKMIMHFTCQRSDAKFTGREAGLRAHCLTLLYFPQQVSHANFVRIVTRNVLCSHRSSVVWIVVGVECAALMRWRQCQRQSERPRGDNTIILTTTTTSVSCTGTAATTQRPCPPNPHCLLKTSLSQARAEKYEEQIDPVTAFTC